MNSRKTILIAAACAAIIVAGTVLVRVLFPSAETRLTNRIESAAQEFEKEDLGAVGGFFSEDYRGSVGNTKEQALSRISEAFEHLAELNVSLESVEVDVQNGRASALVVYSISGKMFLADTQSSVPFRNMMSDNPMKPEALFAEFRENDGNWQVEFVTWDVNSRLADFPKTAKRLRR
jgi:hypothetical protein